MEAPVSAAAVSARGAQEEKSPLGTHKENSAQIHSQLRFLSHHKENARLVALTSSRAPRGARERERERERLTEWFAAAATMPLDWAAAAATLCCVSMCRLRLVASLCFVPCDISLLVRCGKEPGGKGLKLCSFSGRKILPSLGAVPCEVPKTE
jgi:hypothetical protein